MDKRLEEYFVKQYPNLFRNMYGDMRTTCMAWGCSCGNGWFHLMNAAFGMGEHPGAILLQVKEKLGGLRLYWMGPGPPDFPALTKQESDKMRTAMDTAEDRSYQVCEVCGDPGKLRTGGWLYTYCDRCAKLSKAAKGYEIDPVARFALGALSDATGDRIARSLNLRTTCATKKDHQSNQSFEYCLICKVQLRVVLPAVEYAEEKATIVDCPQINPQCKGKLTKNETGSDWACDTCGKEVGVLQVVVPPQPRPEKITAMNCPNCDGELGDPDWKCDICGTVINVTKQPKK